jgi:hypothetical protein
MVLHIDSDAEEARAPRPKRVPVPSAKVISVDNAADQELPSHRRAHIASCTVANTSAQPIIPPPSRTGSCLDSHTQADLDGKFLCCSYVQY